MTSIKAFFWKYITSHRDVEFLCSPKPEGLFTTILGTILLVIFVTDIIVSKRNSQGMVLALIGISAALTAYGIYFWRLRTRPIKRTICTNTLSFRLYHRNLWAYAAYSFATRSLTFIVLMGCIGLIDGGFSDGDTDDYVGIDLALLAFVLLECLRSALLIYQYDHSPVESRHYADGQPETIDNNTTDGR